MALIINAFVGAVVLLLILRLATAGEVDRGGVDGGKLGYHLTGVVEPPQSPHNAQGRDGKRHRELRKPPRGYFSDTDRWRTHRCWLFDIAGPSCSRDRTACEVLVCSNALALIGYR